VKFLLGFVKISGLSLVKFDSLKSVDNFNNQPFVLKYLHMQHSEITCTFAALFQDSKALSKLKFSV
jgi:hypothetical protein